MSNEPRFDRAALIRYVATAQPEREEEAPTPKRLTMKSLLAVLGGNTGDALSTIYAVKHGAQEGNPIYGRTPSTAKILAVKGAGTLGQLLALSQLAKAHPTAANLTAKLIAGGMSAVTAHNIRMGRRTPEQK